jgi:hypothetical protein
MAAKLATVDEHILADACGSGDIRDAAFASSGANERLRDRVLQLSLSTS